MFTEEKAYINNRMNRTISSYLKCLEDVGISNGEVGTNLTRVTWDTLEDTKWSTCASVKTFARNCSSILHTCLDQDYAEIVLTQDFQRMTEMIYGGLGKSMLGDFNLTSCDIFGGSVSIGSDFKHSLNWCHILTMGISYYFLIM